MKTVTVIVEYKFSVEDAYLESGHPIEAVCRLHEGVILEKRVGPHDTACIARQPLSRTVSVSM